MSIVEVVEVPAGVAFRLIDLLVGVLRQLVGVVDEVAPRPPMDILATALKMTSSLVIGAVPSWTHRSI
jgi:hypothetical protein